jgi:hypothetical protein
MLSIGKRGTNAIGEAFDLPTEELHLRVDLVGAVRGRSIAVALEERLHRIANQVRRTASAGEGA